MITLNLLPDIKRDYLRARRTQAQVISGAILLSIVAIGVVVVAAVVVYGIQGYQKKALTDSINKNAAELKAIPDIEKYVTVQNQLANISQLHADKPIISRIFDIIPKLNPKEPNNVKIANMTVDVATTSILLEGETSSFTGLETFRDTLKNAELSYRNADNQPMKEKLFKSDGITIVEQGLGKTEAGAPIVSFKITAVYSDNLFVRANKDISVTVPNKETTQSKQDAPSVFGEPEATRGGE